MYKLRKFLILLLIVVLGSSIVMAENISNDNGTALENDVVIPFGSSDGVDHDADFNVTYVNGSYNSTYSFNTSENDEDIILGFCLEHGKQGPMHATGFNVTKNTSSLDGRIKELIVRYFRHDNTLETNRALQNAIWTITSNFVSNRTLTTDMLSSLTNLEIGDTYEFVENGKKYFFNFFLISPNEPTWTITDVQRLILFNYTVVNGSDENITEPSENVTEPDIDEPDVEVPILTPESQFNESQNKSKYNFTNKTLIILVQL